jgi:cytidylate kinase
MDKMLQIIGVAGTNGAGKDTVGHVLAEHHRYLFISVTDLLRAECQRRNLPVERENLRTISAEWRRELGLGVLVDKAVAEFETVKDSFAGVVIASLRNPGEADRVHEMAGTVLWIDAEPHIRYERIQKNVTNRGRAEEDTKTFEQFIAEEEAEMHSSGDAATLNMTAVKDRSDKFIDNTGENLQDFRADLEQHLNL